MASIDLTFLKEFTKNDSDKMKKYINMFLQHAPAQIDLMEKYYSEKNWPSLKVTAHSLKPQMNYMGIREMEHIVKDIEYMAGTETNTETLPDKIALCRTGCEAAFVELKSQLETF